MQKDNIEKQFNEVIFAIIIDGNLGGIWIEKLDKSREYTELGIQIIYCAIVKIGYIKD